MRSAPLIRKQIEHFHVTGTWSGARGRSGTRFGHTPRIELTPRFEAPKAAANGGLQPTAVAAVRSLGQVRVRAATGRG